MFYSKQSLKMKTTGFTLIELLVVIAIIAILAAMLLPALNSVKTRGQGAICVSNLKALGQSCNMYATSFNDYFISQNGPEGPWLALLAKTGCLGVNGDLFADRSPEGQDKLFIAIAKASCCPVALSGAYPLLTKDKYSVNQWSTDAPQIEYRIPLTYGFYSGLGYRCLLKWGACGNCAHYHGAHPNDPKTHPAARLADVKRAARVPFMADTWVYSAKNNTRLNNSAYGGGIDYTCRYMANGSHGHVAPFGTNASHGTSSPFMFADGHVEELRTDADLKWFPRR